MIRTCIFLFLITGLTSCGDDQTDSVAISASSCASQSSAGEVVDCEVDVSIDNQLSKGLDFFSQLDKTHPGLSREKVLNFKNEGLLDVIEIYNDGSFLVNNGDRLFLAGLDCGDKSGLKDYLTALFVRTQSKVGYQLTGLELNGTKYAYVHEFFDDLMASMNETTITSQWCQPIKQDKHVYHERYQKIFEFTENHLNN